MKKKIKVVKLKAANCNYSIAGSQICLAPKESACDISTVACPNPGSSA